MAIQGKFEADFSSFEKAVATAQVSLRGFEASTGKVETSLNRMVDNFGGRKIITEATLMAQAVERVGGTSHLTAAELQRVGAVAAEAAEKLKAWGQDVPKNIQDLATHAKAATGSFESMKSVVTDLAVGFAALFTVRAAVNFVNGVLDQASALVDLSQQTHISIEDIQVLAGAMSEFGVDQDTLAKGLFTLSRKIATGDDSVDVALRRMGLSLAAVKGLEGEALFLEIEHGLARLQGSLRDQTASDLFGSRLGMAMAGAAEGIDGAMEAAKRMAVVSTEAAVEMDKYGESIARAQKSLSAMAANMIGPVAQGFNVLNDAAVKGASKWDIFKAMFVDFTNSGVRVGASTTALASLLDKLNQQTATNTGVTKAAAVAQAAFVGPLQQTTAQLKASADAHRAAAAAAKTHAADVKKAEAEIRKELDDTIARMEAFEKVGEHGAAAVVKGMEGMKFVLRDLGVAMGDIQLAASKSFAGMTTLMSDFSGIAKQKMFEIDQAVVTVGDHVRATFAKIPDMLIKAFEGGGGLKGAIKAIGVSISEAILKPIMASLSKLAQAGVSTGAGIATALGGATGGGTGAAIAGIAGSLGGAALAASAWGTSMAAAGVAGSVALGAATLGIGAAAIGVYALVKHWGAAEKQINKTRQSFVDAAGGLEVLNQRAQDAGLTLDHLLQAKNVTQYNNAINELNSAIGAHEQKVAEATGAVKDLLAAAQTLGVKVPEALKAPIQSLIDMKLVTGDTAALFALLTGNNEVDFKKMEEVAGRYNIALKDLGPAFQSAKLSDAAKTVVNDFDMLVKNGADADKVLHGMAGSISHLVDDALEFGVAIPENMRPWVEQLAKTHQLIGDNGKEITDLSGLKFAAPIVSEFDKLIAAVQTLIDKLTDTLPGAIKNIPAPSPVHVPVYFDVPDMPRSYSGGGVVQAFAGGGRVLPFKPRGTDTVPAMLTPGETVRTAKQEAALSSGNADVVAELQRLRADNADLRRMLPKAIRDAILLAPKAG